MTTDHQQLAERYLAMLNQHDPDAVDGFVAVGYINHNPFVADGREANRAFWAAFFTAFPDLTATMDDLIQAGDRVAGRFTYRAIHRGPFYGIPPTGRPILEAYRFRRQLYYATCAILVSIPSSYSEGVRYPSPF